MNLFGSWRLISEVWNPLVGFTMTTRFDTTMTTPNQEATLNAVVALGWIYPIFVSFSCTQVVNLDHATAPLAILKNIGMVKNLCLISYLFPKIILKADSVMLLAALLLPCRLMNDYGRIFRHVTETKGAPVVNFVVE